MSCAACSAQPTSRSADACDSGADVISAPLIDAAFAAWDCGMTGRDAEQLRARNFSARTLAALDGLIVPSARAFVAGLVLWADRPAADAAFGVFGREDLR